MKFLRIVLLLSIVAVMTSGDCHDSSSDIAENMLAGNVIYPHPGMEGLSLTPFFMWEQTGGGDNATYDLVCWKSSDEATSWSFPGRVSTTFTFPEDLEPETWYKWELTISDGEGTEKLTGDEPFEFKTGSDYNNPPFEPDYKYPSYHEEVPLDTIFYWEGSDPDDDELTYDLEVVRASSTDTFYAYDIDTESYAVPTLYPNSIYFWRITVKDGSGYDRTGLYSVGTTITTDPPGVPYGPGPENSATVVPLMSQLSWSCDHPDGLPMVYHVYFGKMSDGEPAVISEGQPGTSCWPPSLENDEQYVWRVVASDTYRETSSPDWRFTTGSFGGDGVYALLTARRTVSFNDPVISRNDYLTARFDAGYAPDGPVVPLMPDSAVVTGGSGPFVMDWDASYSRYSYSDYMAGHFLDPGSTYSFKIYEGDGVTDLRKDFNFPECEVYITGPAPFSSPSLEGFELTWNSTCSGNIDIEIRDTYSEDPIISFVTEDDGSYTFSEANLSHIPGSVYEYIVVLIKEYEEPINAGGYDPRSRMVTRIESSAMYSRLIPGVD